MNIEQIFYALTTTVGVLLMVLTLQRLLSGWWRQYFLLVLILVLNLTALVPAATSWASVGNWKLPSAQRLYWMLNFATEGAITLLILQLTLRVGKESPGRATLIRFLAVASIAVAAISVIVHFDKRPNTFMASVTRDLTFLAALLNMVLWRFLIELRKKDFLLLAVSAGVGIQCTGDAIGHSFRILARQIGSAELIYEFGNILMSLSGVITLAIWHTAFSRSKYPGNSKKGTSDSLPPGGAVSANQSSAAS